MGILRGEALVSQVAYVARLVVLPGAMAAALIYSPQQQQDPSKQNHSNSKP